LSEKGFEDRETGFPLLTIHGFIKKPDINNLHNLLPKKGRHYSKG